MSIEKVKSTEAKLLHSGLENFPLSTVIIENALMSTWILLGAYLCHTMLTLMGWLYLIFGFSMVLVVMRILVCRNCYYHGKVCHTAWGKLSALYCKQGDITRFGCGFTGKMIPIFYGSMTILPVVLGIISITVNFSFFHLGVLFVFMIVTFLSSFTFRKKACSRCKMKDICPG